MGASQKYAVKGRHREAHKNLSKKMHVPESDTPTCLLTAPPFSLKYQGTYE